jgi:hypothetical protein
MYKLVILNGNKRTEYPSFELAFKAMYQYVKDSLINGGMSWQELETMIWIEKPDWMLIMFYDARDYAYEIGLMKDGELTN